MRLSRRTSEPKRPESGEKPLLIKALRRRWGRLRWVAVDEEGNVRNDVKLDKHGNVIKRRRAI